MYVLLLALGRRQAHPTMKTRNTFTSESTYQRKVTVAIVSWWQGKVPQTKSARFASRRVFFCISNRDFLRNVTPVTNYTDRIPGNLYGRRAGASGYKPEWLQTGLLECRIGDWQCSPPTENKETVIKEFGSLTQGVWFWCVGMNACAHMHKIMIFLIKILRKTPLHPAGNHWGLNNCNCVVVWKNRNLYKYNT